MLFHMSYPQNLIDDLHMGRAFQTQFGIASYFLQLIGRDASVSEVADNVKQELNAVWKIL